MIALQHRLREELKTRDTTPAGRRRILWEVLHDKEVWSLLNKSPDQAWERVAKRYLA